MDTTGPNAEQIEYWNHTAGPRWAAAAPTLDGLIGPLGREAIERARVSRDEHVLDVGCGTGDTSVQLGQRVGASGSVLGVDLSRPMLDSAVERARELGLAHVRFEQADAQIFGFGSEHDLLFSRFGVMFFADPAAAFANLRTALRDGGRLVFVCWQGLERNAWMREPLLAALKHVPPPEPPAPGAPGPFSFADPDHVRGILEAAGYDAIGLESLERNLRLGGDVEQALAFTLNIGPLATALREVDAGVREAVAADVRRTLERFTTDEGVFIPSASWIVTAR